MPCDSELSSGPWDGKGVDGRQVHHILAGFSFPGDQSCWHPVRCRCRLLDFVVVRSLNIKWALLTIEHEVFKRRGSISLFASHHRSRTEDVGNVWFVRMLFIETGEKVTVMEVFFGPKC